jgi:hypothetical protein
MLKELFEKNKNIIINTDIDGILSGAILVKHLYCKVVGFTNSKDTVWLADDYDDLYKHVYVDMFVTSDAALCVDQHIVAVNASHQKKIIWSGTKYGPHIDNKRIFTDYDFRNKYPFGTVHYIIAQLEEDGLSIKLPDLYSKVPNSNIQFGDLILRADDAMKTSLCAYKSNAQNWWEWLLNKSGNAKVIVELIDYLKQIDQQVHTDVDSDGKQHLAQEYFNRLTDHVEVIKNNTKNYFSNNFSCRTSDGGYKNIIDASGNVLSNFLDYVDAIGDLMNCKMQIPTHFIAHVGQYDRTHWIDSFEKDFLKDYTINGQKVFSYAFIYGPSNYIYPNFSFTVNMK